MRHTRTGMAHQHAVMLTRTLPYARAAHTRAPLNTHSTHSQKSKEACTPPPQDLRALEDLEAGAAGGVGGEGGPGVETYIEEDDLYRMCVTPHSLL